MKEMARPGAVGRRQVLDAVRGIAVALVVGYHYWTSGGMFPAGRVLDLLFSPGEVGVDVFFVLSGYLLGGQLLDHRRRPGALAVFYMRRAARILPLYAILIATAATAIPSLDLLPLLTMTQNIVVSFQPVDLHPWVKPTWSLAVEEQFYLLLPALIFLTPVSRLPIMVTSIAVLSVASQNAFLLQGNGIAAYVFFPCRLDSLCLGVMLAWRVRYRPLPAFAFPAPAALSWLGRRSYCAYLFHIPFGTLALRLAGDGAAGSIAAITMTMIFAELSWRAVESPLLACTRARWRYRRTVEASTQPLTLPIGS